VCTRQQHAAAGGAVRTVPCVYAISTLLLHSSAAQQLPVTMYLSGSHSCCLQRPPPLPHALLLPLPPQVMQGSNIARAGASTAGRWGGGTAGRGRHLCVLSPPVEQGASHLLLLVRVRTW
jgi:hypothetical protein